MYWRLLYGRRGYFSEVNEPTFHTKEMAQFGIDAIQSLIRVNKEIGQNLRIRVGINVDSPIVAGVFGTKNNF
jgi:hypothetical protein